MCGGLDGLRGTNPLGQSRTGEPGIDSTCCMSDLRKLNVNVHAHVHYPPSSKLLSKRGRSNITVNKSEGKGGVKEGKRVSICCFRGSWTARGWFHTHTDLLSAYLHTLFLTHICILLLWISRVLRVRPFQLSLSFSRARAYTFIHSQAAQTPSSQTESLFLNQA